METDGDDFADLLQQADQLAADAETGSDLPRVARNLNQIYETSQRLVSKVAPISQDSTDVKAWVTVENRFFVI